MANKGAAAQERLLESPVRQQLDRVLASATFQQADRLRRFLAFIGEEAIDGRSDQLKEYVVGVQVFGKDPSFDPRTDPVVRVQARRLRARLVQYYREEGQADEIVIELPKGGYAPHFRPREGGAAPRHALTTTIVSGNTIAVLPFSDHSPGRSLEFLCQGLREEIVNKLATVETLRVLAWQAKPQGEAGVASVPGASMVITGSVRSANETVRITTQLIDGASGSYLWSESVDVKLSDGFAAQERVADLVLEKLEPELRAPGSTRGGRRVTENLAAHNLYLQGRYHLNQRTEEGLHKAVDFFEKSLVEDAQYALAHSGLSDAYGLLGHYGVLGPGAVWTKAAASAASAVMLDGNSAEAHTSLAHAKATQDWDWRGAEREFQRAIELDPRYATAHHWYATSCLTPMGRLDEALEQMRIARFLDPVSAIISRDVAVMHLYRREFDAALEQCDQTIELNPHFSPAYLTLSVIQEQRKELDESVAACERAVQLSPHSPRMLAALARSLAIAGRRPNAVDLLRQLSETARDRYVSPFDVASVHFALGQLDEGFEWLSRACQDRCFELLAIRVDPRFEACRSDARFDAVVAPVGRP